MSSKLLGNWTDERVEALKKHWVDGLTCSQIANLIGGVSRNAVIGKIHRLGLSGREKPSKPGIVKLARPPRPPPAPKPRPLPQAKIIELPKPQAPVMPNGLVQLVDLQPLHCRCPVGDPRHADFGFCGQRKLDGEPYCGDHANRAYTETLTPEQRADAVRKQRAVRELTRGVRRYA